MTLKDSSDFIQIFNELFGKCEIVEQKELPVSIDELEKKGEGRIYIWLKEDNEIFKIVPSNKINIGCIKKQNKPDGIILEVNFENKKIFVYLIELKKNLISKLEKAIEQLSKAYWFIKSLSLEECFKVKVILILGYKDELNEQNLELLKFSENELLKEASNAISNYLRGKKSKFPVKLPFCKYKLLNFKLQRMEKL